MTKNFVGSPHIDELDQTFQYVCSFGSFDSSSGVELCIEDTPENFDRLNVVKTHNRLVKVDGRFIHFVRGFGGGIRYSLVFYSLNEANHTVSVTPIVEVK